MRSREEFDLSKRQIEILRKLAECGVLSMTELRTTAQLMQDLYWRRPRLADGFFRKTGATPDDRFWEITDDGLEVLAQIDAEGSRA